MFLKGGKCHRHLRKTEAMNNNTGVYLVEYLLVFTPASEKWNVNDTWEKSETTTIVTLGYFDTLKFVK